MIPPLNTCKGMLIKKIRKFDNERKKGISK